jgi:hypothetical protein
MSDFRPQQPLGRSGGLSVETFYSEQPKTTVASPIVEMQCGLPAQIPVVRPQRSVHPYFTQYLSDPNAVCEQVGSYDAETPEGKAIAELAQNIDASEFTSQEMNNLIAVMDSAPGQLQGWTNLTDVWQ